MVRKTLQAALVLCLALGPTACASTSRPAATSPTSTSITPLRPTKFDVCRLLSDEQFGQLGLRVPGRVDNAAGDATCGFDGQEFNLGFQHAWQKDLAFFASREELFGEFTRFEVNGRHAARFLVSGPSNCSVVMPYSAEVSVWLWVFAEAPSVRACPKVEEIARLVEPRLPRS